MSAPRQSGYPGGWKRRGMTVVEAAISIVLVGVMLVASLNTVGASRLGQRKIHDRLTSHQLAQELMAEILQQDYAGGALLHQLRNDVLIDGKLVTVSLGPEAGENTGDRSLFDDVDDYSGWSASPPQERDGTELSHLPDWKRQVLVQFVKYDDASIIRAKDEGAKLITITVSHDDVPVTELVALRTIGAPPTEACCVSGGMCVDLLASACAAQGGKPQGSGSTCLNTGCSGISRIAHWRLDDGFGATASDAAGSHDGTLSGPSWATGQLGGALEFDGAFDYVLVGHQDDLSLTEEFTFAAWIRKNNLGVSYDIILNKGTTGNNVNYSFGTLNREITFGFYSGGWREFSTSGLNLERTTWYHIAATFDSASGDVILYLNGAEVLHRTASAKPLANTEDLYIGRSQYGEYWEGRLDDVRIYDCALSPVDIAFLAAGHEPEGCT